MTRGMKAIGAFLILLTLSLPIAGVMLNKHAYYSDHFSDAITKMLEAATSNDAAKIKSMLASGMSVNAGKEDGVTPLLAAAGSGSDAVVDELLQHHPDIEATVSKSNKMNHMPNRNNTRLGNSNMAWYGEDGDTALLVAVRNAHPVVMQKLLDAGASIHKNPQFDMALQQAVHASASPEIINPLLDHGFVFGKISDTNATLLLWAIDKGDVPTIKRALKMGVDVDAIDTTGHNALLQAMHKGIVPEIAEILARRTKAINICCRDLTTPLHEAVKSKANGVVKILLERGANTNIRDGGGQTPLMIAVAAADSEAIKMLIAHHADTTIKDSNGQTAIEIARSRNLPELERLIKNGGR